MRRLAAPARRSLARVTLLGLVTAVAVALSTCAPEEPEDCAAEEVYAAPGCEERPAEYAAISAGCYAPCDAEGKCPEGQECIEAWVDPCYMAACAACGGSEALCAP